MNPAEPGLMSKSLSDRLSERLVRLREEGLLRQLRAPRGLDLSSNDYLQLAADPRLVDRLATAARRDGCGSTGSRLLRGERDAMSALERRFARFKGTARSLYFGTGYQANLAVLTTFPEPGDLILSDERNHASLIDGMRLSGARRIVFPHLDAHAVGCLLRDAPRGGQTFVVTESLFSMDGDVAPLAAYAALCREHGAVLVVDEAHAVGVFGARGSGLLEHAGLDGPNGDVVLVSVNTAGKALGVAGAFVAGSALAIEYLVQRGRPFVFSTAPPPALAGALEAALDIVAEEPWRRTRLLELSARLRARLVDCGVRVPSGWSQIVPLLVGDNEGAMAAAASLQARGFDVRGIRPPSVPAGTARLRISVNVGLDEATIDRFAEAVRALAELGG